MSAMGQRFLLGFKLAWLYTRSTVTVLAEFTLLASLVFHAD